MIHYSDWDILRSLIEALRWTILLSLTAFLGGGIVAALLLLVRLRAGRYCSRVIDCYVFVFQGTPLLIQLFIAFFGLGLIGIDIPAWLAATVALIFWTAAYFVEIWRGCVDAISAGQWTASAALGMRFYQQLRYVILPQAVRIAIPPTTGFLTHIVKATALTSIIGFSELARTGSLLTNTTFRPFFVYAWVAVFYFLLCWPITFFAHRLEQRLHRP